MSRAKKKVLSSGTEMGESPQGARNHLSATGKDKGRGGRWCETAKVKQKRKDE